MSSLFEHEALRWLLLAIYTASAVVTASHALLHKRDARSAWGWIAACWLFPLAGAILYYLFGVNRLQQRAKKLMGTPPPLTATAHETPSPRLLSVAGVDPVELRELVRIGGAMTTLPLAFGNRVEMLCNGEQAYPAMLKAIAEAQHSIDLCTYIFEAGKVGDAFVAALIAAHSRGVQVRVLVDGMSAMFFASPVHQQLQAKGVKTARFLPPRWFPPMLHVNLRNHRKLLVIDSRRAFTGGMNIRDAHLLSAPKDEATADLQFSLQGPVVQQLEQCFIDDWQFATGEVLTRTVQAAGEGDTACRVITDGPNEDLDKLVMILTGALANAHHRVLILTPYFIPNAALMAALQAAALRGVEVHLLLPARSDQRYVDWAARKYLEQLLHHQVKVWLQPAPFAHTKLFVVDGFYAQIGSANLDQRSLRLNFELVVELYDRNFVQTLADYAESARAQSAALTLAQLNTRSLAVRLRDSLCWLFSPYL